MKLTKKVIMTLEMSQEEIAMLQELVSVSNPEGAIAPYELADKERAAALKQLLVFRKDAIHELDRMQGMED